MALTRLQLGLSAAHLRQLDRLSVKLGLDRTNTLRYCISRVSELEGLSPESNQGTAPELRHKR